ncbi:MAG TPA: aminotransferase class I/II-fold pyridoxal phosphate-dependent enzyme [Pyrinomonadaceae bacterium]|nr:aminotransferase class I/II-fold pyridoxal phosphate-dependent enzyme [Pyrinomonadaceae bacterium]
MSQREPNRLKNVIGDLQIFGGRPAFDEKLHVGRPNIGNRQRFAERVNEILERKWLTNNGPCVEEFEQRIQDLTGVKHCVAICNATIALEIAIRALGLEGEVIVPSFTFVATAHALLWQGITPIFCDIDPQTHTIAPDKIESLITPRTTGIIAVNLWGNSCDIAGLEKIATGRGLKLLFDSAHAFGCSYQGRMIGNFGNAEVFSFHATKFVNSSEGGAIVTNDDNLSQAARLMQNFGFTSYDQIACVGTNGKMSEICAAMGLTNLESMTDFIEINRRHRKQYAEELAGLSGLTLLPTNQEEECNYQYVVLEIDAARTVVTRDELMQILHRENVLARRYFYPGCHRMKPYNLSRLTLVETERVSDRVLSLPTGTSITPSDISTICGMIRLVITNGREVSEKLRAERS